MAKARRIDQVLISVTSIVLLSATTLALGGDAPQRGYLGAALTPEVAILGMCIFASMVAPRRVKQAFTTYRWPSFDLALGSLGFGVVILLLLHELDTLNFNATLLICMFCCATLGFGNGVNAYFDYVKNVDTRDWAGDDGRLAEGDVTLGSVRLDTAVAGLVALTTALRMGQLQEGGTITLAACAVSVAVLYMYTGPPFFLKYRALGEVCVSAFSICCMIIIASMLHHRSPSIGFLLCAAFVGLMRALPNYMFNIRDYTGDRNANILTLPILLGERAIKISFGVIVGVLLSGSLAAAYLFGPWVLASTVTLPLGVYAARKSARLPLDALFQEGLMMEYVQYHFLALMIACALQAVAGHPPLP